MGKYGHFHLRKPEINQNHQNMRNCLVHAIAELKIFSLLFQMAANVFGSKRFNALPPDKGSFPLDHEGECKKFYLEYMICLNENKNVNSACRELSKAYLGCRMDKGLMKKEGWDTLGYSDLDKKK